MLYSLAHVIIILIHGTWGTSTDWYQPGGHFHDMLQVQAERQGAKVVPFCWSGENSPKVRERAAQALTQLITSYPQNQRIYIVAHSHGGTVAILASELLAKQYPQYKLDSVYLLGTPAAAHHVPNMNTINYVYNLFSFQDFVQPIGGACGRVQPNHPRITNMGITINGKEPGHTDMHHYAIGLWLANADKHMHLQNDQGFTDFKWGQPGMLHFFHHQEPEYALAPNWNERVKDDKHLQGRLVDTILFTPNRMPTQPV